MSDNDDEYSAFLPLEIVGTLLLIDPAELARLRADTALLAKLRELKAQRFNAGRAEWERLGEEMLALIEPEQPNG